MKKNFSIKEALSFGWHTTKNNSGIFFGISAIFMLWTVLLSYLQETFQGEPFSFVLVVVMLVGNMILTMGLIRVCLDFYAGEKPKLGRLFSVYSIIHLYFAASLLFFLMVGVGLLLLIIPGIILALIFWFYDFIVVDKKLGPIAALKESHKLTRGVKIKLFLFLVLLLLSCIAFFLVWGILTFPLGFIFALMPAFFAFMVYGLVVGLPLMLVAIIFQLAQTYIYKKLRDKDTSLQ